MSVSCADIWEHDLKLKLKQSRWCEYHGQFIDTDEQEKEHQDCEISLVMGGK